MARVLALFLVLGVSVSHGGERALLRVQTRAMEALVEPAPLDVLPDFGTEYYCDSESLECAPAGSSGRSTAPPAGDTMTTTELE
jgi:hypothetical protein